MRGQNIEFKVGGIKAIFKKNWEIDIDSHDIDSKLSYGENFFCLYDKYIKLNISEDDLL